MVTDRVALVTGAARRLGREISQHLHTSGYRVILHYSQSKQEALDLAAGFNRVRADSAVTLQADLTDITQVEQLAASTKTVWGRLDLLINNASVFMPDNIASTPASHACYQANFRVNSEAPYILSTRLAPELSQRQGQIINMVDIYADRPLNAHTSYSMSKAANAMLVQSLAIELAPEVRVNGIAPGAILWPEQTRDPAFENYKETLLDKIPLRKLGTLEDITRALQFILECGYLNGQILRIDGGRSVTI
ncbi:MAG: pteridine reductase [Oleiphilus sp.]|nr:MAG: pteridine reductase [Oleiphilus sp.]